MNKYTAADKVYTENSMLDELVHNVKLILQGIIVKDQQLAEDNETPESIAQSDVYMAIKEDKLLFTEFSYDGEIMREMNQIIIDEGLPLEPFTDEQIIVYVIDNSLIPNEYRDLLKSIASDHFMENYVELNNYYRRLNGQKDLGDADFYVDISFIPPTYYQQFVPSTVLASYNSTGKSQVQIKSDMREMAIEYLQTTPITEFTTYQISLMDNVGIMDNILEAYPELPYLRHLGYKKIDIYTARKAPRFDILYLPDCESQIRLRFQDIYETTRVIYLKRYYSSAYKFENPYYDRFFAIMLIVQAVNDIVVEMPEYFISRTVFDNRTVQLLLEANGVKYFPEIPLKYQISMVRGLTSLIKYKSTTKNMYDIAKLFFLKDITVYKYYLMKKRNISSDEILPDDYDGGGVDTLEPPNNAKLPEDYKAWYDSFEYINSKCDKILVYEDEFGTKYFNYRCDGGDMKEDLSEDKYYTILDGGTPLKSVNFLTGKDLDKMYSLFFIKVPIDETVDNYLRDPINHTPYDVITNEDDYWDGPNTHNYVKYEILKKNFTTQCTKYLSLGSSYSMKDYMFQVTYFLNLLLNTAANAELINLQVPVISSNAEFNIRDLIILLYCFSFKYFVPQTDDLIDLNNRDPLVPAYVDPTIKYGDYDPEELHDWSMDGGWPNNMLKYYNGDGGKVTQNGKKPININGGGPIPIRVSIDFPETAAILYDEFNTIIDYDGHKVFEYIDWLNIDGGSPLTIITNRDNVLDGGYVVNSYLYTGKEDLPDQDPCLPWQEDTDKYPYPTLDLSDRINGFNMEANLDELAEIIEAVRHPKFRYYRGYSLYDIIPSFTQTINIFEKSSDFPTEGVIGELYEESDSGRFYIWNPDGYMRIKTVYSKGIMDFKVPTKSGLKYASVDELLDIYSTNKEIYDNLIAAIRECDTQDELCILEYVKDYLFTMRWDQSYLALPSTGIKATRYTEFLKEKDGILYAFYESIMSETNVETRQYNMATYIDQVIDSINSYLSTDMLEYLFYFVPTISWGVVLKYISLIVNFFKSYKTHILDIGSTMVFDNEEENAMIQLDQIRYKSYDFTKGDWAPIFDVAEFITDMEKDDFAIKDRYEDRIYINNYYGKEWVDINGGYVDQNYWSMDIDANDNTHNPGYLWPYTNYYVLDGGYARDAVLDPLPDPLDGGIDYDPNWHGDFDMNGGYPVPRLMMDNADGYKPYINDDATIIDIDGGKEHGEYAKLDSPHFTGIPTAPTASDGNYSYQIATTEFVQRAIKRYGEEQGWAPAGSADTALFNARKYTNDKLDWVYIRE